MKLRRKLKAYLSGWKSDLPAAWRPKFDGFELDFNRVREDLEFDSAHPVYPGRRGHPPAGAPAGSHILKALDGINPGQVRLVVLGQDPYPNVAHATGRSFEQGDLPDYSSKKVTTSMRRILQALAEARTGKSAYVEAGGWGLVKADLAALNIEAPGKLWNGWRDQGAIFLNAGLTLTKFKPGGSPEQKYGHIPLWQPFIAQLLKSLAALQPFVFVTWGEYARKLAGNIADWGPHVVPLNGIHPAAGAGFLKPPNQFVAIGEKLKTLGGAPFRW
jgi:uracil-DNA glycosylase